MKNEQSVELIFHGVDQRIVNNLVDLITPLIKKYAFEKSKSHDEIQNDMSFQFFSNFAQDLTRREDSNRPDEDVDPIPLYERISDSIIREGRDIFIGSISKCWNCGRPDHLLRGCTEPPNPSEISKNKLLFLQLRGPTSLDPPRRYFEPQVIRQEKSGSNGRRFDEKRDGKWRDDRPRDYQGGGGYRRDDYNRYDDRRENNRYRDDHRDGYNRYDDRYDRKQSRHHNDRSHPYQHPYKVDTPYRVQDARY